MAEPHPPPAGLDGEAAAEWRRVSAELESLGTLAAVDRAILVLYCQTWAVNRAAAEHVARYGPIVKWPNGQPGPSPFYRAMRETAIVLRGLLADLGLTPATRKPPAEQEELPTLDLD